MNGLSQSWQDRWEMAGELLERWGSAALVARVRDLDPIFHWLADGERFWFRRDTEAGGEIVLVEAATLAQTKLFDVTAAVAAIERAGPPGANVMTSTSVISRRADTGPFLAIEPDAMKETFRLTSTRGVFRFEAATGRCTRIAAAAPADVLRSPDGSREVFARGANLWVREVATGSETQLTPDGTADFAYGDVVRAMDQMKIARQRAAAALPPQYTLWSPDGQYLLALRFDYRPFPERLWIVDYLPRDEAFTRPYISRGSIASDDSRPRAQLSIIDVSSGRITPARIDGDAFGEFAAIYLGCGVIWWTADRARFFFLQMNRAANRAALVEVNVATGAARTAIEESAPFRIRLNPHMYAVPSISVLPDGREAIWYSERSGTGQLYLYDLATGQVKRALTPGPAVVFDLLRVDPQARKAYFTAGASGEGGDPYHRHLYCVGLDGEEPQLLTPEEADHKFTNFMPRYAPADAQPGGRISPGGRYIIDSFSTVDNPTRVVVRKSSGERLGSLLTADATALTAAGWKPPQRFVVKAADGMTDLHGVMYKPSHFDARRKYPIIDYMYPGPQLHIGPVTFAAGISGGIDGGVWNAQALAEAGFIVAVLDARGTTHRSRAFHDAFLPGEDVFGAADHVAAIRNLAHTCPFVDSDRVGVTGGSFGGYGSLHAFLLFPDFFKVGVAAVGPGDWLHFEQPIEGAFGDPSSSRDARQYYDLISANRIAGNLRGRLLLLYGALDENASLKFAFETIDAFVKADKPIDVLVLPDAGHEAWWTPYGAKRVVSYFAEHLLP